MKRINEGLIVGAEFPIFFSGGRRFVRLVRNTERAALAVGFNVSLSREQGLSFAVTLGQTVWLDIWCEAWEA